MPKLTKEQIVGILLAIFGIINDAGLWLMVGVILIVLGDDDD